MRESNGTCYARQVGDQKSCHKCNLLWDVNDDDPPNCLHDSITYKIDQVIEHEGDNWRITSITKDFIIATRATVVGEPQSAEDVISIRRDQ